MKIPGFVFVIVGLGIICFGYYKKVLFFEIIGSGCVAYGIGKIIFNLITKEKTGKLGKTAAELADAPYYTKGMYKMPKYFYCNRCRTIADETDKFCRSCGMKLR